jgi:hypothetical protein
MREKEKATNMAVHARGWITKPNIGARTSDLINNLFWIFFTVIYRDAFYFDLVAAGHRWVSSEPCFYFLRVSDRL